MLRRLGLAAGLSLLASHAQAQNTLYPTPYMGLNTFYTGLTNNQTNAHALADSMVSSGLAAAGWTLLSIDAGWATGSRDGTTGEPGSAGFAAGMAAMATYIHSKGLKAGLYTDSGPTGYGGGLGSWTHYPNDLDWIFNQWGYDFLKTDTCGWRTVTPPTGCELGDYQSASYPYTVIPTLSAAALSAVSKPYAIEGPTDSNAGNVSWALNPLVTGLTSWYAMTDGFGFVRTVSAMTYIVHHPGAVQPYNYPHPDMLEFNKGSLSFEQEVANFEMYAILSAPLMLGADPSGLDASDLAVLTNPEIIAINQDTAVNGALRVGSDNANFAGNSSVGAIVLYKYLATPNTRAVFLFNRGGPSVGTLSIGFTNAEIGMTGTFNVRDVRTQTNLATGVTSYTNASIAPGEGQLLKITAGTDTWTNSYQIATGSNSTVSPFAAALNQVDGVAQSTAHAIDSSGCSPNCAPDGVYQTARVGQALLVSNGSLCVGGYSLCSGGPAIDTNVVVQPGTYRVRVHLCENWKTAANQRKFNLAINNAVVATNLDVYALAGGQYKAIYQDYTVTTARPLISVTAYPGSVDQAMISGIEITPSSATAGSGRRGLWFR